MSKNQFGDKTGSIIGNVLAANDYLETLDMSWNMIRGSGAWLLAKGLKVGLNYAFISQFDEGLKLVESQINKIKNNDTYPGTPVAVLKFQLKTSNKLLMLNHHPPTA